MDLDKKKLEILSILGDIEYHHAYFKARGVDVSDAGDRECHDIICRIERRLLAQPIAKEPAE